MGITSPHAPPPLATPYGELTSAERRVAHMNELAALHSELHRNAADLHRAFEEPPIVPYHAFAYYA